MKAFGLVDDKDKPTWFTEGKPDLLKMLDIAGSRAKDIPVEKRAAYERALFGAQGGGGFAMLADPAVREQIQSLQKEMNSPEFKNRYGGFSEAYKQGSSVQQARTAMAEFNVTAMELGKMTLPAVNEALKGFKSILEGIRGVLPGGDGKSLAVVGGHAGLGALGGAAAGAMVGAFGGPVGAVGGAVIGGVIGGAEGVAAQYMKSHAAENSPDLFANRMEHFRQHMQGSDPAKAVLQPLSLSLNIDGHVLAEAMSSAMAAMYGFPGQAPAADGMGQFYGGDHNFPSK